MDTVYVVTFYYEAPNDEFEYGDVYGVYTTIERAKAAAKVFEKKCLEHAERYNGYSITEWMLDADNGALSSELAAMGVYDSLTAIAKAIDIRATLVKVVL